MEQASKRKAELQAALAELAKAEAELAAAKAELATAEAGKTIRVARKAAAPVKPKRARRPVHHSELRAGCSGTGHKFPTQDRLRIEMTPVVTKQYDPTDRPNKGKMPKKVSVRVYNDAGQQQGLAMTMTERESDRLEADLPFGWTITSRRVA